MLILQIFNRSLYSYILYKPEVSIDTIQAYLSEVNFHKCKSITLLLPSDSIIWIIFSTNVGFVCLSSNIADESFMRK